MTMPAIAPPLRPLLVVDADKPVVELPPVAVGVGVPKGTVVVAEPVDVMVWTLSLVGRMKAEAEPAAVIEER